MTDLEILQLIDDDGVGVTRWEGEFLDSCLKYLEDNNGKLSPKQRAIAENIYAERA